MRIAVVIGVLIVAVLIAGYAYFAAMPLKPQNRVVQPLTPQQTQLRANLQRHVEVLAGEIGDRNTRAPQGLARAAEYIERTLREMGYTVERQTFKSDGLDVANLSAEIPGSEHPDEIVILGAHYDSVFGTVGANDNASGVAAVLELARAAKARQFACTLRFVFFVNEEPPHFQGEQMGSVVYARRCRERGEKITAMLSIETIGYYSDEKGSQQYPSEIAALFPKRGNFLAFASNVKSAPLLHRAIAAFRAGTSLPAEGGSVPESVPGVGWSDHWSFWQNGYHAIMLTDTAPFRYPHYHTKQDTPDKLDYDRFTLAVIGIEAIMRELAG